MDDSMDIEEEEYRQRTDGNFISYKCSRRLHKVFCFNCHLVQRIWILCVMWMDMSILILLVEILQVAAD